MTERIAENDSSQYDLVLVDQSKDARDAARIAAETRLTNELNEGGRFKRFIKSVWKGNIAKDYYRSKYELEAHHQIEQSQDILVHESALRERRDAAMNATIKRFQSEYDEMIHTEAGETKHELQDQSDVANSLKGIIREFAEGNIDERALLEERARVLQAYKDQTGQGLSGEGVVQIDNMLDVARAVKGAVEHGESLDTVLAGMKVISAESRSGIRTEVEYTKFDRVLEKLSKSKIGSLLGSEATIAATTIAMSVVRLGSKRVVGAAAMTLAPGVGAGLLAGLREKKRVKDDWAQHSREMAQGKDFRSAAERRLEMEEARYETATANDLIDALGVYLRDGALETDDALQSALDQLAAVQTRESLSDSRSIDLISYSSATSIEDERFRLALARAEVKVAVDSRLNDETRARLGLGNSSVNDIISTRCDKFIEYHEADMSLKDKALQKLRNRRVATAAAVGVATGLTFGLLSQEAAAAMSDSREGLVEQLWSHSTEHYEGREHQTVLEGLFNNQSKDSSTQTLGQNPSYTRDTLGAHGKYTFSDNMSVQHNSDGTISFVDITGKPIVDNIEVRSNGSLSHHSQVLLEKSGLHVEDLSHKIAVRHTQIREVPLHDFLQRHSGETTRITREFWYDNDTPSPVYDKNELGLHWGGGGDGVSQNGHIQMSVSTMTADGSYHDALRTAWQENARNGTLKLAISPDANSQTTPFLVDIKPDGTVDVPKDSPAAKLFTNEGGQAVFHGKYAEVIQVLDKDGRGAEHVRPLATLVGRDDIHTVPDTVTTTVHELRPRYEITAPPIVVENPGIATFTEVAPVIPVVGRRSLENAQHVENPYYYGYDSSPEQIRRFREEEVSPRLNRDRRARLETAEELRWYRDEIRRHEGDEYADQIDQYIDDSPELQALSPSTKAIVTIPVAGASEYDNIYKTLQSYAMQEGGALDTTTLLLHVNWFDTVDPNKSIAQDEQDANVRRTFDEIERAKLDFPQLNIAIIQTQWERAKKDAGGYGQGIIGHVARRMYDAAMMSIERQMRDGKIPAGQEVLLIRNDSDAQGIQRTYLSQMVKSMDQHPEKDVFTGAIRWGVERHSDLPGFGVASNFREIMHILASRKDSDMWPPTVGINTAVRMSTFAAVGGIGYDDYNGAGSDDLRIGGRVKDARVNIPGGATKAGYRSRFSRPLQARYKQQGPTFSTRGISSAYGTRGLEAVDDFTYHQHVIGATIDTSADRLERTYANGIPIRDAWGDWETTTRSEGLSNIAREDLSDPQQAAEVVSHIEMDISAMISESFHSSKHVRQGLAFIFPDPRHYRIIEQYNGRKIELTAAGKKFLINRLQRDGRGRFDPYGSRARRALYNRVGARAKKQPIPPQPVLV